MLAAHNRAAAWNIVDRQEMWAVVGGGINLRSEYAGRIHAHDCSGAVDGLAARTNPGHLLTYLSLPGILLV